MAKRNNTALSNADIKAKLQFVWASLLNSGAPDDLVDRVDDAIDLVSEILDVETEVACQGADDSEYAQVMGDVAAIVDKTGRILFWCAAQDTETFLRLLPLARKETPKAKTTKATKAKAKAKRAKH
jgi:hypothetical protein